MKDKEFLVSLIVLTILAVLFASVLEIVFVVDYPEIESFNFSKRGELIFEDGFRGTNPDSDLIFASFMHFECPSCVEQYPIIRQLMDSHPEVNFLFKHLINMNDADSLFSAQAFECAKLQGQGYELADFMFSGKMTQSDVYTYLETLPVDIPLFVECMDNTNITKLIEADSYHASYLEVRGSPTIFLNGIKIEGYHDYDVLDQMIEAEEDVE